MEDLPVTVVKTETILLPGVPEPEAIVEPEIERVQFMKREAEAGETIVAVERVIPPDAIELKKQLKVPVEIMAPQPNEILTSPYEGLQFRSSVKEQRKPVFQLITPSEKSDNIVNNLIDVGKNVLERLRAKEKKDIESL